jgi:2'-hydroxyisoflavone reductase
MAAAPTLDVLVLGGTSWVGGAVAQTAVERGHRVTCLARGESGEPPAEVRWVRADRRDATAYDQVAGLDWDAVLDVSWQPDLVRSALAQLVPRARHWVYVSSGSVYASDDVADSDEHAPVHEPYPNLGPVDWDVYGPAKVACELACRDALGDDRTLVARAGLIGGDGDRSDRLGYWPAKVARASDDEAVLVPPRDCPAQVIDVRDLATWLVDAAEQRLSGVFNAVGDVLSVGSVLEACVQATGRQPRFVEASDTWLIDHGVEPWQGPESLPLWLPQPAYAGFSTRRNRAAVQAGLRLRDLSDTVGAALQGEHRAGLDRDRRAGLTPALERELLAAFATHSS